MSEGEQLRRDRMAAEAYLAGQYQKSLKEEREDLRAELDDHRGRCPICGGFPIVGY